jgi:hypothetical protein
MNVLQWCLPLLFLGFGLQLAKTALANEEACTHALSSSRAMKYVKVSQNWSQVHLSSYTEELRQHYEANSTSPLWQQWWQAQQHLKELNNLMFISGPEQSYFADIYQAAFATVTKHQLQFARAKNTSSMDLPRHMLILKTIADTDPKELKFSAYKIKRAIEGRHSLREYVNCK